LVYIPNVPELGNLKNEQVLINSHLRKRSPKNFFFSPDVLCFVLIPSLDHCIYTGNFCLMFVDGWKICCRENKITSSWEMDLVWLLVPYSAKRAVIGVSGLFQ
jgi:small-conductance mechanosensitive channel